MKPRLLQLLALFSLVNLLLVIGPLGTQHAAAQATDTTARVSVASDGTQGNKESFTTSISADGRYTAFMSNASNLNSVDTNGAYDIFVHNRQTGLTTRVSVASDGTQANGYSYFPSISADGYHVAFLSFASNLDSGESNAHGDIFVHDMQTGQTTGAFDGALPNGNLCESTPPCLAISSDGRYVAFKASASNLVSGDTNGMYDVFVHDMQTGQTNRVSVSSNGIQSNSWSGYPSISGDGRYIAFASFANNLVSGDTNGYHDIFVHDMQTGQTTRVSVASDGTQSNNDSQSPFHLHRRTLRGIHV